MLRAMRRLTLFLLLALPAAADVPGWSVETVSGKPAAAFRLVEDGTIEAEAAGAVGFLIREVPSTEGGFHLAWRWRIDAAPPPTDLSERRADDRPLAVHVVFPPPPAKGLLARAGRMMRDAMASELASSRTITFVWGGLQPRGTRLRNPFRPEEGVLVVLRGPEAPLGAWEEETVDLAAEYHAAFGGAAPKPTHLSISSDTDDRGGLARGRVSPPRFVEGP